MTTLSAENVRRVFENCLFRDGEPTSDAIIAEVVMHSFGFNPSRLAEHKQEIKEMLECLSDEFRADKGGGWSFLQACVTKDGDQWGEHQNINELLALGIATGQAKILMHRELWSALPGGMPYFVVTT